MKVPFLLLLTLLLGGCISTEHSSDNKSNSESVAAANPDGLVCKREKPTGSNRSIKVCRTVAEIERDKEQAEDFSRRVRTQSQISTDP